MPSMEPSLPGRVLIRRLAEAGRNQGLRQLIVARILEHGGRAAFPLRVGTPDPSTQATQRRSPSCSSFSTTLSRSR